MTGGCLVGGPPPARVLVFSSQAATNGFAGSLCPPHLRSTGIG